MSKRVLLIANEYTTIIHFRQELITALVSNGYAVAVAVPDHARTAEINALGCETISLPMERKSKNPFKDLAILYRIWKVISFYRPDIVFTFTIKPNVYGGLACTIKHVPYVANITGLGTAVEKQGLMQKITSALYKIGLRGAQKVFFQNDENKNFMIGRGIYKGKYKLIPGSGVNLERYKLIDYPVCDYVNFVYIARLMKEKGIEEYLSAAEVIKKKYPNTQFHICGCDEGDYKERVKKMEKEGTILYHGMVKDMSTIYSFTHCTILPTFYPEGMNNVLLESAASGKVIITTDRAGCREIVEDGINGFIIRPQDSVDLIEKIEKFLSLNVEQQKAMGIAGRHMVEREFDRTIVVNAYLDEIKTLGA